MSQPALTLPGLVGQRPSFDHVLAHGRGGYSGWGNVKRALDRRVADARRSRGEPEIKDWRLHDLRRTMATALREALKVREPVVEAILNHADAEGRSGAAGAYNHALYWHERQQAFVAWAKLISSIVTRDELLPQTLLPTRGWELLAGQPWVEDCLRP